MAGAVDHAARNDQPVAAAAHVASAAHIASVRRRFYRFFQFVWLDSTLAARVVVELLGLSGKPWVLAIDRTNWDFGKVTINILMISVVWNDIGVPLLWMLLPTAGNSHTSERTELLDRLRAAFPDMKIAALMGDREFIGDAGWQICSARTSLSSSAARELHVLREGYAAMSIAAIARHLRTGETMIVKGGCRLGRHDETLSAPVRLVVTRLASGELWRGGRATQLRPYRQRWTIDLTNPDNYAPCRTHGFRRGADGENRRRHGAPACHQKPGRRAWSLFALGLNTLRKIFVAQCCHNRIPDDSYAPNHLEAPAPAGLFSLYRFTSSMATSEWCAADQGSLSGMVDTTVHPKAMSFPTDADLPHAAIKGLNRLARKHGVGLRQPNLRVAT